MAANTEDGEENAITVAMRIRPMSQREVSQNAENIMIYSDGKIDIEDPLTKNVRNFNFDYTYTPDTSQEKLYEDFGNGMVDNCLNGYNSAVLAYGQTGTGKSFTIIGEEGLQGLCPRVLEKLFSRIDNAPADVTYKVSMSVLEIYNEAVSDLLQDKEKRKRLQVRHYVKTKSFYVQDLTWEAIDSYAYASQTLETAFRNRTIRATMMNVTSSRGHLIIGFQVQKLFTVNGKEMTLQSELKFADLAGSERTSSTGATGDRLKEGASINKSLACLGNVISALAERSKGHKKKVLIPYRDSVLTSLLAKELGGNCKTIIVFTASPADINYDETLSTFRYASRITNVKNRVKVNIGATDQLILDLQKENEMLMNMLTEEQKKEMENQSIVKKSQESGKIEDTDQLILELRKETEKLKRLIKNEQEKQIDTNDQEIEKVVDKTPHLLNLHEDPSISGKISYPIKQGSKVSIGNPRDTSENPDIILLGPSIAIKHALLQNEEGVVTVLPLEGDVYVNGKKITKTARQLYHNDRVMFGGNNLGLYVFKDPLEKTELNKTSTIVENVDFDFAQREIARYADVEIFLSTEDIYLKEKVVRLEQNVKEANYMAQELNRPVKFDIVLISAISLGEVKDMCHTFIQGRYQNKGMIREFLWTEDDFYDRFAMMSTEYGKSSKSEDISASKSDSKDANASKSEDDSKSECEEEKYVDPFVEPEESAALIGVVFIPLMGLSSMKRTEEMFSVESTRCNGYINIGICPCDAQGREIDDYRDPMDLLGHPLHFKIKIDKAKDLPEKYLQTWCQYKFYMDPEDVETTPMSGKNPNFGFCKQYAQSDVTIKFIDYLESNQLIIQVFGKEKKVTRNNEDREDQSLEIESLKEKIKDLRARKKAKHDKMERKKTEVKELKGIVTRKDAILERIEAKAKASSDPLAKEILEILKDNT